MKKNTLDNKIGKKDSNNPKPIVCALEIRSVNLDGSYGRVISTLPYTIRPIYGK